MTGPAYRTPFPAGASADWPSPATPEPLPNPAPLVCNFGKRHQLPIKEPQGRWTLLNALFLLGPLLFPPGLDPFVATPWRNVSYVNSLFSSACSKTVLNPF